MSIRRYSTQKLVLIVKNKVEIIFVFIVSNNTIITQSIKFNSSIN